MSHLDVAFARIWTLNESQDMLELQASAGMYTHINGGHARVPVGQFKIGLIAQERKPHLTNAVIGDPRVSDQEWARREGMVAFAGYPLLVDGRLMGVIGMFARRPLSEAVTRALATVADILAVRIQRKEAEEALRARDRQLQAAEPDSRAARGRAHRRRREAHAGSASWPRSSAAPSSRNATASPRSCTTICSQLLGRSPLRCQRRPRRAGQSRSLRGAAEGG